jgi:hypothetical protein
MFIGKKPTDAPLTSSDVEDGIITNAKLAQDIISGDTALGAEPADTDEFLVSDAGTLKRVDYSYIKGGGITEADQWRISASHSGTGYITANWERNDNTEFGLLGTGMSESSGVFTFPSTGFWLVKAWGTGYTDGDGSNYIQLKIEVTADDSTYNGQVFQYGSTSGNSVFFGVGMEAIVDVTNASNFKVKLKVEQNEAGTLYFQGDSGTNRTYMTFIRLGDT